MYSRAEIAPRTYQFRFYDARRGIGFNQYLVQAECPALVSTGAVAEFPALWEALSEVLDPADLRYLVVPHFESDEAGALAAFLARCPEARPVCAAVAARQVTGFGLHSAPLVVGDGDRLDLGGRTFRFVLVPWEMHLWDGVVAFEEQTGVLFSSDLFGQRLDPAQDQPADLLALTGQMSVGSVPVRDLRERVYAKLAALDVRTVAPGHGHSFGVNGGIGALAARVESVTVG
jgi:flavorubredoxin